jgi:hypothetical protein
MAGQACESWPNEPSRDRCLAAGVDGDGRCELDEVDDDGGDRKACDGNHVLRPKHETTASAAPQRLTSLVPLPCGRPRAMAGPLPYELFENILDLMDADVETLKSCASVNSTWRGPVQARLFRTITLDHDMAWPGLLNVLETTSHLHLLVRNIRLKRGSNRNPLPLTPTEGGRIPALLPNVDTLVIRGMQVDTVLVQALPNLRTLELYKCPHPLRSPCIAPNIGKRMPQLHVLRLLHTRVEDPIEWLEGMGALAQLRRAEVVFDYAESLSWSAWTSFVAAHPTLKELTMPVSGKRRTNERGFYAS